MLSANLKNSLLNLVRKNSSPGKKRCSSCSWQPSMSRVRTRQSAVVVWCVWHRISTGFEPLNADPSYLWARPRIGLRWQDQQAFTFQLVIGNIRCISSWRNFFDDFFHHGIFFSFHKQRRFHYKTRLLHERKNKLLKNCCSRGGHISGWYAVYPPGVVTPSLVPGFRQFHYLYPGLGGPSLDVRLAPCCEWRLRQLRMRAGLKNNLLQPSRKLVYGASSRGQHGRLKKVDGWGWFDKATIAFYFLL